MHNIEEIKDQNKQDCFSLLYAYLTGSLVEYCGRNAEGTVREAVRRMAFERGSFLRKKHVEAGIKTNLRSLYNEGSEYMPDPRMYRNLIAESEEVRLWEIRTCPLADLWNKAGVGKRGLWCCEELQRGIVAGYTNGKGQMNQSAFLTCPRDNHCRFSAYFRAANLEEEQLKESFSTPEESVTASFDSMDKADFSKNIRARFICFYCSLLSTAKERHGDEGVCAVAQGLRRLADELALVMRRHAEYTLQPCDESFIKLNFPVSLNTSEDDLWQEHDENDAPKFMQINLLDRLKEQLGFSWEAK